MTSSIHILTKDFASTISALNSEKKKTSPLAVVILGKYDPFGAVDVVTQALLLQVAKTQRVALRVINDASELGPSIRGACLEFGSKASALIVFSHGCSDYLRFGENIPWYQFGWMKRPVYQPKDISRQDFDSLRSDAKIVLLSCYAGQKIAPALSNITGRTVLAPTGLIVEIGTCLQDNGSENDPFLSYNESGVQQMATFENNSLKSTVQAVPLSAAKSSFFETERYLIKKAEMGESSAQLALGSLYLRNSLFHKPIHEAMNWILMAAKNGNALAQYKIGCFYLSEKYGIKQSNEEAVKWIQSAAEQQFAPAVYHLGLCHYYGRLGFSQSDEEALKSFIFASKNGTPQAHFYLGCMYELGQGVDPSQNQAKMHFKIAAEAGVQEARSRLASILFSEERFLLHGNYYINKIHSLFIRFFCFLNECVVVKFRHGLHRNSFLFNHNVVVKNKEHEILLSDQIREMNSFKDASSPTALILKAEYDPNGIFSSTPSQSLIFQIAKTHRVAIKTIKNSEQFNQAIKQSSSEFKSKHSILVIMAHGTKDYLQFDLDKPFHRIDQQPFFQKNNISKTDFSTLTDDAKIILYSCDSGFELAQIIAEFSNRKVLAAIGKLLDTRTCIQRGAENEINIVSYNENNEQHMYEFAHNKPPAPISFLGMFSNENKASFAEIADSLKIAALIGDPIAQWKLGIFYKLGLGTCPKSDSDAAHWLSAAANKGVLQAQYELSSMYLQGIGDLPQSNEKAAELLKLAAKNGLPQALFLAGVFSLNGQCGFLQSDHDAYFYFRQAVVKGVPEALINLGLLYEHGRGVTRSAGYAQHLYNIAEGLGILRPKTKS